MFCKLKLLDNKYWFSGTAVCLTINCTRSSSSGVGGVHHGRVDTQRQTTIHARSHGQFRVINEPKLHVFGLAGSQRPHAEWAGEGENMYTCSGLGLPLDSDVLVYLYMYITYTLIDMKLFNVWIRGAFFRSQSS